MVAGIHGPGTAHALKFLAEKDFRDRPFGGIIEIELDLFKDWPTRFEEAEYKWLTSKYTPEKLLGNLENASKHPATFSNLSENEIEECIKFVRSLARGVKRQ